MHAGQIAHDGQILKRMMGGTKCRVRQPATSADNRNRHVVVADIEFDLLQTARGDERGDRVADRAESACSEACGKRDHVGLRHAAVVEALGHGGLEFVEKAVPNVSAENHDTLILEGDLQNFIGESVAQGKGRVKGESERAKCY